MSPRTRRVGIAGGRLEIWNIVEVSHLSCEGGWRGEFWYARQGWHVSFLKRLLGVLGPYTLSLCPVILRPDATKEEKITEGI